MPFTSWSYWRTSASFDATSGSAKAARRAPVQSARSSSGRGGESAGGAQRAARRMVGRPRWRNSMSDEADGLPAVGRLDPARSGELAHDGRLDAAARREGEEGLESVSGLTARLIRSWLSETRISQGERPAYLSGHLSRSIRTPPEDFGHLAEARAEAARAVVGDARVQARVPRLEEEVAHPLLDDRVADLHGGGRDWLRPRRGSRRSRRGCRPCRSCRRP